MKQFFIDIKQLTKTFLGRFDLINSWDSSTKQWDKIEFEARIGKLTLFELNIDFNKSFRICIFNLALSFK